MKKVEYNREKCVEYARKWALSRNPKYYNYDNIGGDCTNFASQCIYAGSRIMNEKLWYYKNANEKSPSWTGVEFLYEFLVNNKSIGPAGVEVSQKDIEVGDLVQLSQDGYKFSHSLIIIGFGSNKNYLSDIYIATHSEDSYERPLLTYKFKKIRFIHINEVIK